MPTFNHLCVSVCYSLIFDNMEMMQILYQTSLINDCMNVYLQKLDKKYSDLYAFPYENLKLTDENMSELFSSSSSLEFKNKLCRYQIDEYTEINFVVPVLMMKGKNLHTRTSCRNAIFDEISMDVEDLHQAFKNATTFLTKLGVEKEHIKIGHTMGVVDCVPESEE